MIHKTKNENLNINLMDCKVFNLSEFKNEKIAYNTLKNKDLSPFHCWDDNLDKSFNHILIFEKDIKVLYEHTYGPDDNYTDIYYDDLNEKEINYLKENNKLDLDYEIGFER